MEWQWFPGVATFGSRVGGGFMGTFLKGREIGGEVKEGERIQWKH